MVPISEPLLDQRAQTLLIALQQKPLGSYQDFADMVGLTRQTVSTHLKRLEKAGLFHNIRAELALDPLERHQLDVLVQVPNLAFIPMLEHFAEAHHYTAYRARVFGKVSGLYFQFHTPVGTKKHIQKSFDEFLGRGVVSEYRMYERGQLHYVTDPQLKSWNPKTFSWDFDWSMWKKAIDTLPTVIEENNQEKPTPSEQSLIGSLDRTDAVMMYFLTSNARSKQKDIKKALPKLGGEDLSPQRISERWNYLQQNVVADYRIHLDWKAAGLFNTILFFVKCNHSSTEWFHDRLTHPATRPPFSTRFQTTEEGFVFYIRCPPSQISLITELLWDKVEQIEANLLDFKSSMVYFFDYTALDESGWKGSVDEVHTKPFEHSLEYGRKKGLL